jgi:hypothetical protein
MHCIKYLAHVYTYRCFRFEYVWSLRNIESGIQCNLPVPQENRVFEIIEIKRYHERLQTEEASLCRGYPGVLLRGNKTVSGFRQHKSILFYF